MKKFNQYTKLCLNPICLLNYDEIWKYLFAATPKMVIVLETTLINENPSILKYSYCHTISSAPYHEELQDSPVLCTVVLALTVLFSWRSAPASLRLGCNKTSLGLIHNCTAR